MVGSFEYRRAIGYRSTKPENAAKAIEPDTILALTSGTKIMTAIAVLQCVERGLFDLDEDVGQLLPELKDIGIISKAEGANDSPILKQKKTAITPR